MRDEHDMSSAARHGLPPLQLPRRPRPPLPSSVASVAGSANTAADLRHQPSAWIDACDAASSLSPMASAACGRSFSSGKPGPVLEGLWPAHEAALEEEAGEGWPAVAQEARNLCRLALPTSVTNLAGFLISMVTLAMAGRLGKFELSCIVLGTSIFNVTGLSLLMGFAAAMETFCGQAYGARSFRMVGVVYQRALILTTVMAACVALGWTRAEPLLLLFRQDPLLSRSAARYIQLAIPALWFTGLFEASKRYLMAQGVVGPQSAVTLLGLALSPLYSWLFIFHLDFRLAGAAYAADATQLTMAALLGGYIMWRDSVTLRGRQHATWHGWSREALHGWPTYLRFALPSVVMICCEWWTFEAMILMSGLLPHPDVTIAVMGVLINTSGLIWMCVTGFAMACSTRVANSLGAGCPRTAQRATWTAVGITSAMELAALAAVLALRNHWAVLFTNSPEVRRLTASLLPIFVLSLPGDGLNATLQGLLRGSGRQKTGAVTNLFSYWALGIPAAAYLAFKRDLGVYGLWWGLVMVNTLQGTLMGIIALRFDFGKESLKAAARTEAYRLLSADVLMDGGSLYEEAGSGGGGTGLAEPLLQGVQCERIEQGLLPGQDAEAPTVLPEGSGGLAGGRRTAAAGAAPG